MDCSIILVPVACKSSYEYAARLLLSICAFQVRDACCGAAVRACCGGVPGDGPRLEEVAPRVSGPDRLDCILLIRLGLGVRSS